jgi:predicted AAA+ superfamily ATPase
MLRPRLVRDRLLALLRQFPALTIAGPRQVGKSTLARLAFPDFGYLDLENPPDMDRLMADPSFVLGQDTKWVIDEAQRFPPLFSVLRSHLDRNPRTRVVLLGSASPGLVTQISESLAGRTALFELAGISIFEHDAEPLWIKGGFPRVHWGQPKARPEEWYPAYVTTCLERDIPQLGFRISALRLRNLMTMIAHAQGSLCNLSQLGASLGINYHSVAHILDVLEGVFLVRRLQPYFANVAKRLVRSPKLYLRDTGILHSLLGIPHRKRDLLAHPKAGASFETFCIEQIVAHAAMTDPSSRFYFYRTQTGVEVDLILERAGKLTPIEIKLGTSPPDPSSLESCMETLGLRRGYVVNLTSSPLEIRRGIRMCGLAELLDDLGLRRGRRKGARRTS